MYYYDALTFHITVQWLIKPNGPQTMVTPVTFAIANIILCMYNDDASLQHINMYII